MQRILIKTFLTTSGRWLKCRVGYRHCGIKKVCNSSSCAIKPLGAGRALEKGNPELAESISNLGTESALTIVGKVVANEVVRLGGLEIQLEDLKVEGLPRPAPLRPFGESCRSGFSVRLALSRLRRVRNRLIFEVQTTLEAAMRAYWLDHDFIENHSPKILGAAVKAARSYSV
jgi:aspartyl-tRNA synthetase